MAGKKKKEEVYGSNAIVKTIAATSRASVKVRDNFYTVEYHEERVIPEGIEVDIEQERALLWDTVNKECDNQIADIVKTFK